MDAVGAWRVSTGIGGREAWGGEVGQAAKGLPLEPAARPPALRNLVVGHQLQGGERGGEAAQIQTTWRVGIKPNRDGHIVDHEHSQGYAVGGRRHRHDLARCDHQ